MFTYTRSLKAIYRKPLSAYEVFTILLIQKNCIARHAHLTANLYENIPYS